MPTLWYYRGLIVNFARRDLRARFKGTLFGFAWSLLLPIATLVTYSIVFGVIFKFSPPPLGNGDNAPFPVFLFSGLVPWGMYAVTLSTAIASLLGNGPLMKKIYFPAYASVYGSVLATFYQSMIEFVLLLAILLALGNMGVTWLALLLWFPIFGIFVAAISLMLSVANVYFRDTAHLVSIVVQMQFYMTPIIYLISDVPVRWHGIPLRALIEVQPMTAFVQVFRDLCYGLTLGPGRAWLIMLMWTVLAVVGASFVYSRRGLDLSEEL
jgi:ABC-type polysaccharide/polyol phosphate export permease